MEQPSAAVSAAATNIAAAVTASAIASLSPRTAMDIPVARIVRVKQSTNHAAIVPSAVVAQPRSAQAVAIEARRDPVLRRFEEYLLSKLRPSDVVTDNSIWLFNVNQAAYIIEGSVSKDEKRMTRQRVASGLQNVAFSTRAVPGCNLGEFLKTETDRQTHGGWSNSPCLNLGNLVLIWDRQTDAWGLVKLPLS
jgi:hypothetical protein